MNPELRHGRQAPRRNFIRPGIANYKYGWTPASVFVMLRLNLTYNRRYFRNPRTNLTTWLFRIDFDKVHMSINKMLGRYSSIKILFNQIYPHDCVVCGTRPQLGSESSRGSRVACWGAPCLHDDLVCIL